MTVLVIAELNHVVGMGHKRRADVVVDDIRLTDNRVRVTLIELSGPDEFDLVASKQDLTELSVIIVDVTLATLVQLESSLRKLSRQGIKLVGIDSARYFHDYFDSVWVPSMTVMPDHKVTNVTYGWNHYLIESHLHTWTYPDSKTIGVVTGSSDHLALYSKKAFALREQFTNHNFVWLKGPYANWHNGDSSDVVSGITPCELSMRCDLVISVFGVSSMELLSIGCPSIIVKNNLPNCDHEYKELENVGIPCVECSQLLDVLDSHSTFSRLQISAKVIPSLMFPRRNFMTVLNAK